MQNLSSKDEQYFYKLKNTARLLRTIDDEVSTGIQRAFI